MATLAYAYQEMREPGRVTAYWRGAATAIRDTGNYEVAANLEQRAANAQTEQPVKRGRPSRTGAPSPPWAAAPWH